MSGGMTGTSYKIKKKCEKNRKKTLTNADFQDYNECVLERKTKGKQMSLE